MCTFKNERTVLVCDVAIGRVRQELVKAFGDRVRCTPIDGEGTLVEVAPDVDGHQFTDLARAAIDAAQRA